MNKKLFLSELEKRLSILVENERKDIINEYRDIIEEKVKHGATEEAAVASFGNIDELVKEILSAYKINYDYRSSKDSVQNIVDDCGNLIEKGARWLSDVTRSIVDDIKKKDKNFTLERAFEIVLKFIIVLAVLLIARIPFAIVGGMLHGIIGIGIGPFDWVTRTAVDIIIWVIYIVFCATVCVVFFKKYFDNFTTIKEVKRDSKEESKKDKKEEKKEDKKEQKQEEKKSEEPKETISEPVRNDTRVVNRTDDALGIILKIFVYIMFLIPLFFVNLGFVIAIAVVIYFMTQGLIIWEILLILLGLLVIFSSIEDNIRRLLYNKKVYFISFFIGFILLIVGSLASFELATRIEYYNYLPTNNLNIETKTVEVNLDKELFIDKYYDYEIVVDDSIIEDKAIIKLDYYDQIINVNEHVIDSSNHKTLDIDTDNIRHFHIIKDLVIDNLKDYKLYNYSGFYRTNVKVYVNTKNINKIS